MARRAGAGDASTIRAFCAINIFAASPPARIAVVIKLDDSRRRLLDRPPGDIDHRPAVAWIKPPRIGHLLRDLLAVDVVVEISIR